ncbi:hypothetical protein Mapa_017547 [Marchantia paleacea]|nr:hypothetical protein Mapa_017547 [Marchantia paleacea]
MRREEDGILRHILHHARLRQPGQRRRHSHHGEFALTRPAGAILEAAIEERLLHEGAEFRGHMAEAGKQTAVQRARILHEQNLQVAPDARFRGSRVRFQTVLLQQPEQHFAQRLHLRQLRVDGRLRLEGAQLLHQRAQQLGPSLQRTHACCGQESSMIRPALTALRCSPSPCHSRSLARCTAQVQFRVSALSAARLPPIPPLAVVREPESTTMIIG